MSNYTDTDKFAYLRFWEIDKYTVSVFFYPRKRKSINTLNHQLVQTKTKTPFFFDSRARVYEPYCKYLSVAGDFPDDSNLHSHMWKIMSLIVIH